MMGVLDGGLTMISIGMSDAMMQLLLQLQYCLLNFVPLSLWCCMWVERS